ncbi:MAG TPA: hypothetical protein PKY81_11780 [bacterium]|nr:hypothetical protein [bacterium]HPN31626.1 hypothetical protein [bacterium]
MEKSLIKSILQRIINRMKKLFLSLIIIFIFFVPVIDGYSEPLKFYYVIRNNLSYGPVDTLKISELYKHGLIFSDDILEEIASGEKICVQDMLNKKNKSDISDKTSASKTYFKNEISLGLSKRLKTDMKYNAVFKSDEYKYSAVDFYFERRLNKIFSCNAGLSSSEKKGNASVSDATVGARYNLNISDKFILYFGANAGLGIIKAFEESDFSGVFSADSGIKYYFSNKCFLGVNNSYKHFTQYYKYNDCPDKLKFGGWFASVRFGIGI